MSVYGDFIQKHIARDSVFGIPINRETTIDSALDFLLLSDNIAYEECEPDEYTQAIQFGWVYENENFADYSIPISLSVNERTEETFQLNFIFYKTEKIERIKEIEIVFDFESGKESEDIFFIFNEIHKTLLNKFGLPCRDYGHFKPLQFADSPFSQWLFRDNAYESRFIEMKTDCSINWLEPKQPPHKSIRLKYWINFLRKPAPYPYPPISI